MLYYIFYGKLSCMHEKDVIVNMARYDTLKSLTGYLKIAKNFPFHEL